MSEKRDIASCQIAASFHVKRYAASSRHTGDEFFPRGGRVSMTLPDLGSMRRTPEAAPNLPSRRVSYLSRPKLLTRMHS